MQMSRIRMPKFKPLSTMLPLSRQHSSSTSLEITSCNVVSASTTIATSSFLMPLQPRLLRLGRLALEPGLRELAWTLLTRQSVSKSSWPWRSLRRHPSSALIPMELFLLDGYWIRPLCLASTGQWHQSLPIVQLYFARTSWPRVCSLK